MEALGGARGYNAANTNAVSDSSASILRRASDAAKPEIAAEGVLDVTDADVSAETSASPRPIGNLGHHLDLRL